MRIHYDNEALTARVPVVGTSKLHSRVAHSLIEAELSLQFLGKPQRNEPVAL